MTIHIKKKKNFYWHILLTRQKTEIYKNFLIFSLKNVKNSEDNADF